MHRNCLLTPLVTLLLALLGFASPGGFQDGPAPQSDVRRELRGTVLEADGSPWWGARVTLLARAIPGYVHAGQADELRVVTDAKGEFTARVLPFREYSVWAHERADDGTYRLSGIVQAAVFAEVLALQERDDPQPEVRIRVEGAELVDGSGQLTHRLIGQATRNHVVRELRLDADGEARVPPMPGDSATYELVSESGVRLFTAYVPLTAATRQRSFERQDRGFWKEHRIPEEARNTSVIRIPEPTMVTVRVRTSAGDRNRRKAPMGPAVPGATIGLGAQSSSGSISDLYEARTVATTDAQGEARVPMVLKHYPDGRPYGLSVLVTSETHGMRYVRSLEVFANERAPTKDDPTTLEVAVRPGACTIRGRVLLGEGRPAAHVPVLSYQVDGYRATVRPWVHHTDESGRFRIPGHPRNRPVRITALLPEAGTDFGKEVYLGSGVPSKDLDLGDLRVDEFVTVHCHVRLADGRPAARARIHVGERWDGDDRLGTHVRYCGDITGRASFRAPVGAKLAIFTAHEEGFSLDSIEITGDTPRLAFETTLSYRTYVSGRVVDTDGKPVAGARVHPRCIHHELESPWQTNLVEGVCMSTRELFYRNVSTDDDGRFRIPFPDVGARLFITAWKHLPNGEAWELQGPRPEDIELTAEPITGMELVLEKRL